MTKGIKPLECSIQTCGQPFVVTDTLKDTTFQPGSQGLLSYVMGPDYNNPNIVFQQIVTTRRGKTGKDRLNTNMILSPLFKVPGVNFEAMFPKTADRKHFVEISVDEMATTNIINDNDPLDSKFLSWLLAKSLFVRELDKAVYPIEHQIMNTLKLSGPKQVYAWPKDKMNKLKQFTTNVERWFNEGETNAIIETYSSPQDKQDMLKQMCFIDRILLIPRLEYHRKVNNVMVEALNYISKFINNKSNKVKNFEDINKSLKMTRQLVKTDKIALETSTNIRLDILSKNKNNKNF